MLGDSVNKALEEQERNLAQNNREKNKNRYKKNNKPPSQSSEISNNMMPIDTMPGDTIEPNQNNISDNITYIKKTQPKKNLPDKTKIETRKI